MSLCACAFARLPLQKVRSRLCSSAFAAAFATGSGGWHEHARATSAWATKARPAAAARAAPIEAAHAREVLRASGHPAVELSMGMSGDFEVAIEEGATLVRIGRAIFGERA
jgi:hypothetical protein